MYTRYRTLMGILFIALPISGMVLARPATPPPPVPPESANGTILFVQNAGQWPDAAHFQVWGSPAGVGITWLTDDAIWVVVAGGTKSRSEAEWRWQVARSPGAERSGGLEAFPDPHADLQPANIPPATLRALKITFPGSNPDVRIEPLDPLTTTVSYFLGNDPTQWHPAVPVYGGVRYVDLYPGVDLTVGQADSFWQFEAEPGAAIDQVRVQFEGAAVEAFSAGMVHLAAEGQPLSLALPQASFAYRASGVSRQGEPTTAENQPNSHLSQQAQPDDNSQDLVFGTYPVANVDTHLDGFADWHGHSHANCYPDGNAHGAPSVPAADVAALGLQSPIS